MELELTDDQELLLTTTRRYLADAWPMAEVRGRIGDPQGFDRDADWGQVVDLGWTSLLAMGDGNGGVDDGIANLAIVAECAGAALVSMPVLPTNVVAFALVHWGSPDQQRRHLDALVEGTEIATWAVADEDRWGADAAGVTATPTPDGFRLDGVKSPVEDAGAADVLLVSATTPDGLTQLLVPTAADGVSIVPLETLDVTCRYSRIELRGVHVASDAVVGEVGGAADAIEQQLALAVALQCAETVGATDRAFATTLDYVKERKAFGRPVGSYQAVKHRLADMLLWLESSRAATADAVAALQDGRDATTAASVAKAYVGERCPAVVRECLQFHGGIGYTWEHDVHLFLRRVESNAAIYGNVDYHCDRIGRSLLSTGAQGRSA